MITRIMRPHPGKLAPAAHNGPMALPLAPLARSTPLGLFAPLARSWLSLPRPREVLGTARSVTAAVAGAVAGGTIGGLVGGATGALVGRVAEATATVVALPARTLALLDGLELLIARFIAVMDRAEALVDRTDQVVGETEDVVREIRTLTGAAALAVQEAARVSAAAAMVVTDAEAVVGRAAATVGQAGRTAESAQELLAGYEPALRRAAPMADRFVSQLTHEEITAAIRLVDELPKLTHHMTNNVLPILHTLDRVGPDVHDLLEVTRDLKLAIAGIPGLSMLRRRGEDKLADDPPAR